MSTAAAEESGSSVRTRALEFGPLSIRYDDRVLRPRPWTLAQAEWAAELADEAPPGPLLELCSGAGQIGLAAAVLSGRDVVLVDASEGACELGATNALGAGLASRLDIRHGPMDQVLGSDELFSLVLADPPYIPSSGTGSFPEDPLTAIDGGDDGLDLARTCLHVAARHVANGCSVLLQLRDLAQVEDLRAELGEGQGSGLVYVEARMVDGGGALMHLRRSTETSPPTRGSAES